MFGIQREADKKKEGYFSRIHVTLDGKVNTKSFIKLSLITLYNAQDYYQTSDIKNNVLSHYNTFKIITTHFFSFCKEY